MENRVYLKDVLLTRKPFVYTNKDGETVQMAECYSRTEDIFDENGYLIKHFYCLYEKVKDINIGDFVKVKFSKQYNKFYLSD